MTSACVLLSCASAFAEDLGGYRMNVVYLNGVDSYLELPAHAFDDLTEATVEVWVKWKRFNKWARVLDWGREGNALVIQTEKSSSTVNFAIFDRQGKRHRTRAKKAVKLGEWVHLAAVCGIGGMEFYVNGKRRDDDNYEGGLEQITEGSKYFGKSNWPKDKLLQGYIGEIRVWDRRRSRKKIKTHMDRALKGNERGLVGHWRFDQVDGDAVPDLSRSGIPLSIIGEARIVTVPAISRFLIPGELEKEAEKAYTRALEALEEKDYEDAEHSFRKSVRFVPNYKDALDQAVKSRRLAEEAVALDHYSSAKQHSEQGNYLSAYEEFRAALDRVPNFRDAAVLMEEALEKGSFSVGFCLFTSDEMRRHLASVLGPEKRRWYKRPLEVIQGRRKWDVLKVSQEPFRRQLEAQFQQRLLSRIEGQKLVYVRLEELDLFDRRWEASGMNPKHAGLQEVLKTSRESGIHLVVLAELAEAYTMTLSSQTEKEAWTLKERTYTDSEGNQKRETVGDRRYYYYVDLEEIDSLFRVYYQILDSTTGESIKQSTLADIVDDNRLESVAWGVGGVDPSHLYTKTMAGFSRLSSGEVQKFNVRSNVRSSSDLMEAASLKTAGQLASEILKVVEHYRPQRPDVVTGDAVQQTPTGEKASRKETDP